MTAESALKAFVAEGDPAKTLDRSHGQPLPY
jgi:hypothetical protein